MADELRKHKDMEVELKDGEKGELTVLVDGREVAGKAGDHLPTAEEVLSAVRGAGQTIDVGR